MLRDVPGGMENGKYVPGPNMSVCEKRLLDAKLNNTEFFAFLKERIVKTRCLFKTEGLHWVFCHNDAFLDNTLFSDVENCKMLALFDWEVRFLLFSESS